MNSVLRERTEREKGDARQQAEADVAQKLLPFAVLLGAILAFSRMSRMVC